MIGFKSAATLLLVLLPLASAQCGPSQCYPQSCQTLPLVDFVLMIDTSGSMSNAISGVQAGSVAFINQILATGNSYKLNAAFAIVEFARRDNGQLDPTRKIDMTTSASTVLNQLQVYTPSYLQGWYETGLETIRCITNNCNTDNLNISFRSGTKRVLLMFTDEDSDPPNHSQNAYSNGSPQIQFEQDTQNDMWCPPSHTLPPAIDQTPHNLSPADFTLWMNEVTATANVVISQQWSLYLLINTIDNTMYTCMNFVQYGNPNLAVQQPDFTQWSASGTLSNLVNQNVGPSWSGNSLQAQVLKAGLVAKSFNVYLASNPTFVANFLQGIAGDLNQCNACLSYQCQTSNSALCATPVPLCDCAGAHLTTPPANSLDANGKCCPTSQIDCANVCNGGHSESNPCGVCTAGGATPSTCVPDCAGVYYLTSAPTVPFKAITNPTSPAGYVIAPGNADLLAALTSITAVNTHWQTYGRYEGRYYCTLNYAAFATLNGGAGGCSASNGAACETAFFSASSTIKAQATCQTGTLAKLAPAAHDSCGQCVVNPSAPPKCVQGCDGAWYGASQTTKVFDTCGVCGGNNAVDLCNVCVNKGGDNSERDHCGNCPGSPGFNTGKDNCGQYLCASGNSACTTMCNGNPTTGQPYSYPVGVDSCGQCVAFTSGSGTAGSPYVYAPANCVKQCDGSWYSPTDGVIQKTTDNCGNCYAVGSTPPSCIQDCAGVWNGGKTYDACGQCGGQAITGIACLIDCAGVHYLGNSQAPNVINNVCGMCLPYNNQGAALDNCNRCVNTLTGSSPACVPVPCVAGQYYVNGTRSQYISPCGYCVPNGVSDTVAWNQGLTIDSNGIPCGCNVALKSCNGQQICGDACLVTPPDNCGRNTTNPFYQRYDDCGQCCYTNATCASAPEKDVCGNCPNTPPQLFIHQDCTGKCGGSAKYDCKAVCQGTAVLDCAGVCAGTCPGCTTTNGVSVCTAVCGDGIIEGSEACDDGTSNGQDGICTTTCTLVPANTTGAIVGGVIGGLAALAVLALLAFLLVQYAIRNGLLSFGKQASDMGGAQSNPMYQQQNKVSSNPLYQNV